MIFLLPLAGLAATALSSPTETPAQPLEDRQVGSLVSPYAPELVTCPSGSLVRSASGVNPAEAAWVSQRKSRAVNSFKTFLGSTGQSFPALSNAQYPTMGLVDGGGGFRGFLMSAGIHKAFDSAEGAKTAMAGLYQSMVYESGLSGSAVSLASYAGNNWPTTSQIQGSVWNEALANGVLMPDGGVAAPGILADITAKQVAGFVVTIVDAWARLLSYVSLQDPSAGVANRYSDILTESGYTSFQKPYPITTTINVEDPSDGCGLPLRNASQWEFTPHEFGSWESDIANFMQTKYVGTTMNAGSPALLGLNCINGFDNQGWVMATSTNVFNQQCQDFKNAAANLFSEQLFSGVKAFTGDLLGTGIQPLYALMPNPFFGLTSAPRVSPQPNLQLIDGGETIQVMPIWPFLYRRDVSVLFLSDNSADNPGNHPKTGGVVNLPSGRQLINVATQARANGVGDRLPPLPNRRQFINQNLNKRTVFFGCNQPANSAAMTLIYMPNRPISFNTDIAANKLQFEQSETSAIIGNGVKVATDNNGGRAFATCVACATMKRAAAKAGKALPAACGACFRKYCWS